MNEFTRHFTTPIPQNRKADSRQVKNNAGGYVFSVSDQIRLSRFLILGTPKGTYYQSEADLTSQNLDFLVEFINRDEVAYWTTLRDIGATNRAYRHSPALMALAMLFKHGKIKQKSSMYKDVDDDGTVTYKLRENVEHVRYTASELFQEIVRTGTHLAEIQKYAKFLGVSGRAFRNAVAKWYESDKDRTAYQVVKYRNRHGFNHGDLMRINHPKNVDPAIAKFVLGKDLAEENLPSIIEGFLELQTIKEANQAARFLKDVYPALPWEALPTDMHKQVEVWKTLFYNGALNGQALVRNITRFARLKAFDDMVFVADYAEKLTDKAMIDRTRLHPIQFLNSMTVHREGQVVRDPKKLRQLLRTAYNLPSGYVRTHSYDDSFRFQDWEPSLKILDALEAGYYLAFNSIKPSKKRFFFGIDVSGSMESMALGLDLSCAKVAAAMAMSIARTEPYFIAKGFTSSGGRYYRDQNVGLTDLGITSAQKLETVFDKVQKNNFGRTDCSLPMIHAKQEGIEVDAFVILTDNETWYGDIHPYRALRDYRQATGIDAKLIVVGMTATEFSIADPSDVGMLDVVGADANLPKLVSEFASGRI